MNTAGFIERLQDWQQKISVYQDMLHKQARSLRWRHYQIGLLATLLSLAVGYAIFSRLKADPDVRIQIAVGAGSLISAVLTGIMTFFSHARRSERSRLVTARLGDLRSEIDTLIESPPQTAELMQQVLWKLNDKITEASKGAPAVPFQVREAFVCYDQSPAWPEQVQSVESK